MSCRDAAGAVVPDWRCSKLRPVPKRRGCEVNYYCTIHYCSSGLLQVPCPRDCRLSAWSAWSRCPDLCRGADQGAGRGAGPLLMEIQRRERVVLESPAWGGAVCPPTDQVLHESDIWILSI